MNKSINLRIALLACIVAFTSFAAIADTNISANQLPEAAKKFITTHFDQCAIVSVEFDNDDYDLFDDKDYDVRLNCGVKIEFDQKGKWHSVSSKGTQIPDAIIPAAILEYVKTNYPDYFIEQIDKERNGFDIELNNDLDLKFDRNGKFVRIDD